MSDHRPSAALTPCAGRCSTVFGDNVCRGCRRFSHEVIHWNRYNPEQQAAVWARLDKQIDQILIPLLPHHQLGEIEKFLNLKHIKMPSNAGVGRKLYHALKLCEKSPIFVQESGLGIERSQIKPLWKVFEKRVLELAEAGYELAYIRAAVMSKNISMYDEDD